AACTMRVGLIDNAWWNSTVDPVEGVKLTKKIGYDTYDLYPLKMPSASERKELRQALEEVDLPCYTIIAPVFSLSDLNAEIRAHTVDWAKRVLDLGYDFGCEVLVLAPGEYALEKQEIEPSVQWEWAV